MLVIITFFIFILYYLASFNNIKKENKYIFILLFSITTFGLRLFILPELNKDYTGYFELHNFGDHEDYISFLLSEPYLYILFKIFSFFGGDKKNILNLIYWFNFILTNLFFVWLLNRSDIKIWKKVLFFSFYYFLFGFVLLRNGPVYLLFACFFYYSYRNKFYYKVLLTPFMHLSAVTLITLFFHKNKYYFKVLLWSAIVLIPLIIIFIMPQLSNIIALENSMNKIDSYSKGMETIGVFHKIHFTFISACLILTFFIFKKLFLHPIIITTAFIYYITFYINPVLGFRFSPYVLMSILFFNTNVKKSHKLNNILDGLSFFLIVYFVSTLYDSHNL